MDEEIKQGEFMLDESLSGLSIGAMSLHQEYRLVLRNDGKHHLEIFQYPLEEKNVINRHGKHLTLRLDNEQIEMLRYFLNISQFGRVGQ